MSVHVYPGVKVNEKRAANIAFDFYDYMVQLGRTAHKLFHCVLG